jgi:hypothetical protein
MTRTRTCGLGVLFVATGCVSSDAADDAAIDRLTAASSTSTPVYARDVVYRFSAATLDSYKDATLQCQGTNSYFWQWGGSSGYYTSPLPNPLRGTDPSGGTFWAFGTVTSPGESNRSAFRWELHPTDPGTAGTGAKRCEFSFGWKEYSYPGKVLTRAVGLPANQDNWWAVAVRIEDWSATNDVNDWQVLWQWHDAHGGGLAPFLNLSAKGSALHIQGAYNLSAEPKDSTTTRLSLWTGVKPANTWMRFVVKARKDLVTPAESFVQIWLDGLPIVDYHGPFGYAVPEQDYAKVGIYHWISTANVWDRAVFARRMWTKGPVQVTGRAGYTWQSLDALLD